MVSFDEFQIPCSRLLQETLITVTDNQKPHMQIVCHNMCGSSAGRKKIGVNYTLYYHECNDNPARERMKHVITFGLIEPASSRPYCISADRRKIAMGWKQMKYPRRRRKRKEKKKRSRSPIPRGLPSTPESASQRHIPHPEAPSIFPFLLMFPPVIYHPGTREMCFILLCSLQATDSHTQIN